jgi:hypothetical protein
LRNFEHVLFHLLHDFSLKIFSVICVETASRRIGAKKGTKLVALAMYFRPKTKLLSSTRNTQIFPLIAVQRQSVSLMILQDNNHVLCLELIEKLPGILGRLGAESFTYLKKLTNNVTSQYKAGDEEIPGKNLHIHPNSQTLVNYCCV